MLLLPMGYLVMRVSALDSGVRRLEDAVASLESAEPQPVPPPVRVARPAVGISGADGVLAAPVDEASKAAAAAPPRATARANGPATPSAATRSRQAQRILEVVEREQARVADEHLAYHKERWLESRDLALKQFDDAVGLTTIQYDRLQPLLHGEVERMAEMLKDERYRDDPAAFSEEWDATLEKTDLAVRSILTARQREAWEEARAVERALLFPWLEP